MHACLSAGILQVPTGPVQCGGIPEAACSVAAAAVQAAARLKAEGFSHDEIAQRFGLKEVTEYIGVGFYPPEAWKFINRELPVYKNLSFYLDIRPSLALRIPPMLELLHLRGGKAMQLTPADYAKFDYSEVIGYFQKIADGTLDTREKREDYVIVRRQAIIDSKQAEIATSSTTRRRRG